MALINKQVQFTRIGKPLAILSATHINNLENCIFVEAYKLEHVREAIEGLNFCYQKVDQLPLAEMTKIYENQTELERPERGSWVRIKTGMYQNDIGIVDSFRGDDKYLVKMIPRYDPQTMEKGYKRDNKMNPFQRFPQMAFHPDPEHWKQINP